MQPIILICGAPHSLTSMTSQFLINNGGFSSDNWDDPAFKMDYSRFESKEIQDYVRKKSKFQDKDLTDFFSSLPEDKVITLKMPRLIFFVNELKKYTQREIRVVYVFRNPRDIISSSNEKSGKSFIYHFERMNWLYDFMVDCEFPVHALIAERLLKGDEFAARNLLQYCGLESGKIDFSNIDLSKTKFRRPKFYEYRFVNFLWKRLGFLFKVVETNAEE